MSSPERSLSMRLRRGAITEDPVGEQRARAELEQRLFGDEPGPVVVADRYVIGELVGSGGSGAVYAAQDRQLERKVAVKLLRAPRTLDDRKRARLAREARVLAKLSHPNVVTVFDFGTAGDQIYVAMELVSGSDLGAWLRSADRSASEILAAFEAAGRGLAAAHEQGIVHRDFKPSNVVVGDDGSIKVLDFGLATIGARETDGAGASTSRATHAGEAEVTQQGDVLGTPRYMSPEQHDGREVDSRTDVYSFCAALYEALYDALPWQSETVPTAIAKAKRDAEIRPARRHGVPGRVREILRAGLSPEPGARPTSMAIVVEQLRPRSHGGWWGLAGLAAAVGLVAALAMRGGDAPCEGVDAAAGEAWNAEVTASIEHALVGDGGPGRAQAAAHVRDRLERWIDAWSIRRRDACAATHVEKSQSEAMLDRTIACLDVRLSEFRRLTALLAEGDATFGGRELEAVDELTPVDDCSTARLLARGLDTRELDPAATATETDLAALSVQLDVGRVDGVGEALADILARTTNDPTLHAKALLVRARLEYERGRVDEHVAALEQAVVAAQKGRDSLDRAVAWTRLAKAHGEARDDFDRAEHDLALAAAAIAGVDDAIGEQLQIAIVTSTLLRRSAREPEAREHAERALALARQSGDDSMLAAAHHELADVLTGLERFDDAKRQFETTLAIRRRQGGERNPAVVLVLSDLGLLAEKRRDHDEAHERLSEALTIAERHLPERHPLLATLRENLALVEIGLRRPERARELLVRAIELERVAFGPRSSNLAGALLLRAEVEAQLGDRAAEAALLQEALEIYEGMDRPPLRSLVTVKYHLARNLEHTEPARARTYAVEAGRLAEEVDAPARIREAIAAWLTAHDDQRPPK